MEGATRLRIYGIADGLGESMYTNHIAS